LFVYGGVTSLSKVFGFAHDPAAQITFVTGDGAQPFTGGLQSIASDLRGGTLVTFDNGGKIDVVGDNHFGIISQGPHDYVLVNTG
jgi:hypothetical protein